MIFSMASNDIKQSIVEIWTLTQVYDPQKRIVNPAWHNWVLLDLARRLCELDSRFGSIELTNSTKLEFFQRIF
jgi:hypothetical protein